MKGIKDIKDLPRVVGIMADFHYTKRNFIETLILEVKPKTVITTTAVGGTEELMRKLAVLRGDLYFKLFESDPWEEQIKGRRHADKIRDYLFVSYLKAMRGCLVLFPTEYSTSTVNVQYSRRMRDVMVLAHQLKVPYDVIRDSEVE